VDATKHDAFKALMGIKADRSSVKMGSNDGDISLPDYVRKMLIHKSQQQGAKKLGSLGADEKVLNLMVPSPAVCVVLCTILSEDLDEVKYSGDEEE
jgi:hypothetical protein